jgi:hypothetical protein
MANPKLIIRYLLGEGWNSLKPNVKEYYGLYDRLCLACEVRRLHAYDTQINCVALAENTGSCYLVVIKAG